MDTATATRMTPTRTLDALAHLVGTGFPVPISIRLPECGDATAEVQLDTPADTRTWAHHADSAQAELAWKWNDKHSAWFAYATVTHGPLVVALVCCQPGSPDVEP